MKTKTRISIVLCLLITMMSFSGCYDSSEIEELAYVIAIGIDEADANNFILTFQTAVPKSITGGEGERTNILSFKTDNFLTGFKKTNEYLNRKINLSHTKVIVVSENIAKEGITAFLNGLEDSAEIRPNVNIVVSAIGAKKYIESIQPKLSSNPSRFYDLLFNSYETDFMVPVTRLEDYLYRSKNIGSQPLAVYVGMDENIMDGSAEKGKKEATSINGLAAFCMDKLVGVLTPREATIFALLTGKNNMVKIGVVDPYDQRFKVLCDVKKSKASRMKVTFKDTKPSIEINLKLILDVMGTQSDIDYSQPDKAATLKRVYEEYLNSAVKDLLKKATYEMKTDIFAFGELAKQNFRTIEEWERASWPELFPKSEYNVTIDLVFTRKG